MYKHASNPAYTNIGYKHQVIGLVQPIQTLEPQWYSYSFNRNNRCTALRERKQLSMCITVRDRNDRQIILDHIAQHQTITMYDHIDTITLIDCDASYRYGFVFLTCDRVNIHKTRA